MKSVLAFIDFSDVTDAVVQTTADLARAFNAKLILVHVVTPESDYEGGEMRTDISREGVAGEMHRYHRKLRKLESELPGCGYRCNHTAGARHFSPWQADPENPAGNGSR